MTTRILPPEEWPRLVGTEAETVWPHLNPATAHVLVVEDGGEIVGCQVLLSVMHAECLWIRADHRGRSSVARRLWGAVQRTACDLGLSSLMTAACDDRVSGLLQHVGARELGGRHFLVDVKG